MITDEAFFRSRGFGGRIGFGERPAILVVDLIRAFTDPAMPLGAPSDEMVAQTNRILDASRGARAPVIFSTVAYDDPAFADAGHWRAKQAGITTLKAGTPGVELDPRLRRQPGDAVIVKKFASCFFGTDLVSRLNARSVDTLIVTGCTTSGCVRASVVDSLQLGYRPIVARQAVGDRSESAHAQSLFDIDAKYGDVVAVDEVVQYLLGLQPPAFIRP